ncbi:terminase small subunit [uncultured Tateyamaria sp.]|uniref:terminase small subunit n=1 Tax=uncultured Tateyamaria sp. TaxID=455651 RepID=UPI0026247266|nr:terminase small subunit [uncultured Tateyamaria sp.]
MSELAGVFGVSTNTVKSWLTQAEGRMPCVERGGNGREYVLRLSWCYAWRQHQDAEKKDRAQNLARLQGTLFGIEDDQADQGLSPKQVREVAEARIKYAEAARVLGTLTEMDGVYALFEQVFVKMRDSAMGASDRLERELGLTAPQARQVDRAMEEMLSSLIEELQDSVIGTGFEANLEMNAQLVNQT